MWKVSLGCLVLATLAAQSPEYDDTILLQRKSQNPIRALANAAAATRRLKPKPKPQTRRQSTQRPPASSQPTPGSSQPVQSTQRPPAKSQPTPGSSQPAQPQSTTVIINRMYGEVTRFQSRSKEDIIKRTTEIARIRNWIVTEESCGLCYPSIEEKPCCLEFYQGKALREGAGAAATAVSAGPARGLLRRDPRFEGDQDITCEITISAEEGLSPELIKWVHDMPLTAPERRQIIDKFRSGGVFDMKQLAGVIPTDFPFDGDQKSRDLFYAKLDLAKNQQQTALEGNQANQEAESGEDNRKELFDEQLQKAEAQNAGVKEARQNLQEIANELAQSGSSDVSERAKEQLQEALAKLDEIALEDADLSTDAAQERLDSKIGSGGVTLGRQLKTLELVNYFGLLRGVLVRDRPEDGGVPIDHLGMVCSFKPRFAQQEESLRRGITVVPDLTETEMSVEAESALDMQRAQSVIAAYGRSAMSTVATNYGGSVSVSVGVPFLSGGSASASFEKADSSSSASSSSGQKSTASQLRTTMTELSKSTYFFAPKLAVKIDPLMLQPSPEFKLAWSNIAHKYCLAQQAPPTPATTTTTTAFASANGSSASGTEDIELVDLEDACKKYKVDPDSVYGGSPEEETEEEEDANTAVQISFFATNFDVLATLGALPKKAFEDAVTQAMNYYGVIGDDETIKVTLSRPSKTEVDSSSLLNTVKVVVVIPAKPNEDSEPAGKSRLTFYSEWKTQGPPWGLQSRILDQFDKSDTLKSKTVLVGTVELKKFEVTVAGEGGGTAAKTKKKSKSTLLQTWKSSGQATVTSANATWEDYKSDFLDLIHKFGSHVCPSAILGGWRNIEATYKSQESKERSEVSNVISEAIREAASSSWSASGGVSGAYKFISGSVSASGGSSSSSGSDNSNTGGSSQDTATASKTTNIQVQQSWKGGSSGTSPEDWRRSLDSSLNSNWKVIDHELPKCIGIWWFVSDDFTRNGLCNAWLQVYLDGGPFQNVAQFIEESVRDKACESTRNMALLRNDVQELLRLETAGNVRLLKQRCERNQDFKQFKLKVTTRRGDAATQARLGGVRFASEGVTRIPTSISDKAADGDYLISNSGFLLISFDAPVSVTDFSFLLTQTIANAHEDPVAFRLYGHDGTNPDALLLDFEMDDPTKQITSVPTSVRQAWSPWLGLLGGAEGYSWNDEQGICQKKAKCGSMDCRLLGPFGSVNPREASSFCTGEVCTVDDREKCCSDARYSRRFMLIMTQHQTGSRTTTAITARVKGVTSAGDVYDTDDYFNPGAGNSAEARNFFITGASQYWEGQLTVPLPVGGNEDIRITQLCLTMSGFGADYRDIPESVFYPSSVKILNTEGSRSVEITDLTGWAKQGPRITGYTDKTECKTVD